MKQILTVFIIMISISAFSQERTITGTVSDESGIPLLGATIFIKAKNSGTVTDFDGNFTIKAATGDVISFSYLGTESKDVAVTQSNTLNVALKNTDEVLDEVVVVGYGTVKKSDLTGSISSIKAKELTKTGTIAIDQALAGRSSGVIVTQNSGTPGAGVSINIRGISTISSSQPLYVIDGIPMENESEADLNSDSTGGSYLSPLSLINPSDIESIEILKDASATAIYGSRASNGVVLITTKQGEVGKGVISVTQDYSMGSVPNTIDVMDANQYWISRNEARINGGETPIDPEILAAAEAGAIPTQDWLSILLRPATTSNTNVSFSGGNKDLRYLLSTNLLNNTGVIEKTNFKRIQTRLNLDANINKSLKVGTRITYSYVDTDTQATTTSNFTTRGTSSVIRRALLSNPSVIYIQNDDDDIEGEEDIDQITPLSFLNNNDWNTKQYQILGSLYASLKLSEAFSFKSTFTYQNRISNQRFYQNDLENIIDNPANNRHGWARTSDAKFNSGTITNQLNYNQKFGNHKLNAVLGQSAEWRDSESVRTSNYGFANDLLGWYNIGLAETSEPDIVNFTDSKLLSYFGRINYSFKNKFLFTLTGRYDGSSKFAENNKYAFFPAAAIAYKISKEKFIRDIRAISEAKIRLSYGLTGNQAIREYQSLAVLSPDQYVTSDGSGGEAVNSIYYSTQIPNLNLKWETTRQFDAGLDLGFFKNKYTLTLDYYKKKTTDLLFANNEIPSQSGQSTYTQNYGEIDSQGFEVSLGAKIISTSKVNWDLNATFSTGKSKIGGLVTDYINAGSQVNGRVSGGTQRLINGEAIGTFYGWQTAGVTQFDDFQEFQGLSNEQQVALYNSDRLATFTYIPRADGSIPQNESLHRPGEQLYANLNGDGIIDNDDRKTIGSAQPDFMVGLNNTFRFGNVDFSFFFDGQFGQEVANILNINLLTFADGQQLELVEGAWTPENQSSSLPKVRSAGGGDFLFSDRYVEDASFVRLQNVTIGFTLPDDVTKKLGLASLRVYASGSNLYTFTDYSGFNPDVSSFGRNNLSIGHDTGVYPAVRTLSMGLNLRF
ncbi:TonB-dependent receptor [Oceanihabitans sp. 2_MG-2023]|uniref:SusC/RagA family TonB-linked outer membrane protein n=1 Tax=Oceanihabitans sp. 2_MG-2023 TaxID=3062661 RepID=UPI0026E2A6B6|nr:TonB-dependent receptor [Oceanihabitans sp. 2_MG-2023]MDO6597940.1 TonB-dependent receptor [Oceanihabitans sp. 2_MG-2023]